jgi:hypothetical protein
VISDSDIDEALPNLSLVSDSEVQLMLHGTAKWNGERLLIQNWVWLRLH